jgi:CBS domain containing-hemolysin-like protein
MVSVALEPVTAVSLLAVLIVATGFFSSAEIALFSLYCRL